MPGAQDGDEGSYHVVASNDLGSVTSEPAALTVEPAPTFSGGALAHLGPFLESYWSFDSLNDDGFVPDLAPNLPAHNGELINGAAITSGGQGYGGSGEALDPSNGAEDVFMAAGLPEDYDFNADFTWSARVKIFETASFGEEAGAGIFGRSPSDSEHTAGSKVFYLNGDTLGFDTGWVGAHNSEEPTLSLDTWHQVTITYLQEEDLLSIYLDEEPIIDSESGEPLLAVDAFDDGRVDEFPEDEASGEGGDGLVNSGFRIGGGATGFFSETFPGLIDDAAVWSVALEPEDVALLAQGASPLPTVDETPDPPVLTILEGEDGVVIEFEGTLESASEVTGPWETVDGARSPLTIAPSEARAFYRAAN